ncbi:MAG: PilZ domain-containing protein [Acidobacteria bacterium]|nr:PilZ domain-containing protein [Acidobacteriota bacterium]
MESPRRYDTPRRETRYALQLPVTVSVESEQPRQIKAQSDNISLSGILFSADSPIPLGVQVNVEVSISAVTGQGDASLASVGKIIRVTQPKAGEYKMAVGCERPFQFVGQETWKPS